MIPRLGLPEPTIRSKVKWRDGSSKMICFSNKKRSGWNETIKLNLDELHFLAWEVDLDCSETMHQDQSLRSYAAYVIVELYLVVESRVNVHKDYSRIYVNF